MALRIACLHDRGHGGPIGLYLIGAPGAFVIMAVLITLVVILRHKDNITRLAKGTESKLSFDGLRAAHLHTGKVSARKRAKRVCVDKRGKKLEENIVDIHDKFSDWLQALVCSGLNGTLI
jgi:hypothetical protein